MSASLLALKASSRSRHLQEQATSDLNRDCLVLINSFLKEQGLYDVSSLLESQTSNILNYSEKCENIDLPIVLSEYKLFYEMKHGKQPVYSRKTVDGKRRKPQNSTRPAKTATAVNPRRQPLLSARFDDPKDTTQILEVTGNNEPESNAKAVEKAVENTIIKPVPKFDDPELQALAASMQREILQESPNVEWCDIVGLDDAKRILKEAVVIPVKFPELFTGPLLKPWRGALLFGIPGTGKTLLAKALATETRGAFFSISSSSVTSKFRGDSEKLIRVLFELARYHAPTTIFFDEIDAILGQRSGSSSSGAERVEHEGSRRMKTELLIEMDGLGKHDNDKHVFVLCATNLPWDLDSALLRRLEKRILVPPPCDIARKAMLEKHLSHYAHDLTVNDFEAISMSTEFFTGSDIMLLCKEAAMMPVRIILEKLESMNAAEDGHNSGKHRHQVTNIQGLLKRYPITMDVFSKSLDRTRPSTCAKDSLRYVEWEKKHGST